MPGTKLPKGTSVSDFDLMGGIQAGPASIMPVLVSLYKNKILREQATKAFRKTASKLDIPWAIAANRLADKFPRIAAHIALEQRKLAPDTKAAVMIPRDNPTTWKVIVDKADSLSDATQSMFHEATHVAQNLGNKDAPRLYDAAHNSVGYYTNPFELSAEYIANKRASAHRNRILSRITNIWNRTTGVPSKPYNTMEQLRRMAEELKGGQPAQEILKILDTRRAYPDVNKMAEVIGRYYRGR